MTSAARQRGVLRRVTATKRNQADPNEEATPMVIDDELREMPWTRDAMTSEELVEWVASRREAGRAIDISTCELGYWAALHMDPYGVSEPGDADNSIGINWFARSSESRGWVHEADLPTESAVAMYDRVEFEYALLSAAAEKHPGWRVETDGLLRQTDDRAPDATTLAEWFRESFPSEVRAISAARRQARKRPLN